MFDDYRPHSERRGVKSGEKEGEDAAAVHTIGVVLRFPRE